MASDCTCYGMKTGTNWLNECNVSCLKRKKKLKDNLRESILYNLRPNKDDCNTRSSGRNRATLSRVRSKII